jgi:hypothetical protein
MLRCSDMLDVRCVDANNDCHSEFPKQRSAPWGRLRTTLLRSIVLLLAIFSLSIAPVQAQQTTADVLGTVSDPSGAVIPGASVSLRNLNTNETQSAKSSSDGQYLFNLVKPGTYSLEISAAGYAAINIASLTVQAGDRAREDVHLKIGDSKETVTVTAESPALHSDSSQLDTTISNAAVQQLPLNGRNFINLVQIVPGGNEGSNNALGSGNRPDDRRQTSAISVNGQSDSINDELIDGLDNNERFIGSIGVRPSVDAIQEVRVQTNAFTAEVGRTAGAVVDVITKSGTNQFHGSVYEFIRNTHLNAYPFAFGTTIPKPPFHQNQYGGSVGGPIIKDKTFFFFAYEGLRLSRASNPTASTVPSLFEEQNPGNFSDNSADNVGGVTGPPLILTSTQLDAGGLDYFRLYPTPTKSGFTNNYVSTQHITQTSNTYDARVDHTLNDANSLFARYTYNAVNSFNGGLFPTVQENGVTIQPGGNFALYEGPAINNATNGAVGYTHTFTPHLLLDAKIGYTYIYNASYPLNTGVAVNAAFGMPNVNIDQSTSGLAALNISGAQNLGDGGSLPIAYTENTFQYQPTLIYTHGKHNVKIGGNLNRRQVTVAQSTTGRGAWTVTTLPQLVQGNFTSLTRVYSLVVPHYRTWEPSGFIQDDYHFSPRLTLNLGIRYDVFTPFTAVKNQISNFDLSAQKIIIAGENGVSNTAGIKTDYSNLAPRVGFAATLAPGTVLRGGFGFSFAPENVTSGASLKNQPFVSAYGPCSPATCLGGYTKISQGLPVPTPQDPTNPSGSIPAAEQLTFRSTYIEQFNLTAEKEAMGTLYSLSYVGELGRHVAFYVPDVNAPPPNACGTTVNGVANPCTNANTLRPTYAALPNVTTIPYWSSNGAGSYNALQAKLEHRTNNGLTYTANYTWAHGLDDAPNISQNGSSGFANVPSQISTLDYGNSDLDLRNRFAATINYALPFGKELRGYKAILAKGWQTNLLAVVGGGHPFTVLNASNRNGTRPGVGASDRPDEIGSLSGAPHLLTQYFNTGAFAAQALGKLGSERRNQLYGPGFRHLDASLFKDFNLFDKATLQFRAEAFNVTNTSNFAAPNASLGASNFGTVSALSINYQPRIVQLALKLQF